MKEKNNLIMIDTREKVKAIKKIVSEFDRQKIGHISSKLYVGDYLNFDNPRLIIDRKQNLTELCSNVCQQHKRFREEIRRATEHGIKLIFLCEHGKGVKCLEDVIKWENPRRYIRSKSLYTGRWESKETKAISGEVLYKILHTIEERYDCKFLFCNKNETGKRIIELLGVKNDG